jgi:hypothetical protein
MPSWIEFRLALRGLLLLARFNPDFSRFFDRSPQGALRSLSLVLLIYPFYFLQLWNSEVIKYAPDTTQFVLAMSVGLLNTWLLPPLLIAWLAPLAGRAAEMPGCITVYMWSSVLSVAATLPLMALDFAGLSTEAMNIPYDILLVISLVWEAFLLMHMLRIRIWQAALVTVADYLLVHWILMPIFLLLGGVVWPTSG